MCVSERPTYNVNIVTCYVSFVDEWKSRYLHGPAGESRHGHVQHEQRVQQHDALGDARLRETAVSREEVEHRRQAEAEDERQKHRERDEQRDPHHRQRSHLELTVDNSGGGGAIEPRLMNYANTRKLQDVCLFYKKSECT